MSEARSPDNSWGPRIDRTVQGMRSQRHMEFVPRPGDAVLEQAVHGVPAATQELRDFAQGQERRLLDAREAPEGSQGPGLGATNCFFLELLKNGLH